MKQYDVRYFEATRYVEIWHGKEMVLNDFINMMRYTEEEVEKAIRGLDRKFNSLKADIFFAKGKKTQIKEMFVERLGVRVSSIHELTPAIRKDRVILIDEFQPYKLYFSIMKDGQEKLFGFYGSQEDAPLSGNYSYEILDLDEKEFHYVTSDWFQSHSVMEPSRDAYDSHGLLYIEEKEAEVA